MPSADKIIDLFHEAKLLPPGDEQDAFLARACGDDTELKNQVHGLLRADENVGGLLGTRPDFTPEIEAELARLKPEEAGDRIGAYKLRERIGEGGFGVVWVAEQETPVRRTVALKIIKLGMDTTEVLARFEQERQALAMMDHPNIARIFDAGSTQWGRPYFAMELVHGIKITDYCDKANLPTVERLALFIQVCNAVQHAHQKGIIHRDLKPSNILVTLHDGVPVPKVIDFGVAKATHGRIVDRTIYTQYLQMIGTPLYMSPEQAEMSGLDVDTRTDIYALGVLLYELLTGRTPLDPDQLIKAGYDEMRRVIREEEPQKPSTALGTMAKAKLTTVAQHRGSEPPKLIHAVCGDLDWIVMKTLEKDRSRRYESASALAADIQRHLENEPVTARPPTASYKFLKFARRNEAALRVALGIAALLVGAIVVTTLLAVRATNAETLATNEAIRATAAEKLAKHRLSEVAAERDATEAARQEAEAISQFLSEVFQSPDPARDGRTITVAETLDKAAMKLDVDLADQPARRAKLQATLAETYRTLGLHRQAIPLLEKALEYHRTVSGPKHPETLRAMQNLAISYAPIGRRDEALHLLEEVLKLSPEALGPQHNEVMRAMQNLASFYFAAGRREEALKLREETLGLHRKLLGEEHPGTLRAMQSLATSYYYAARQSEALDLREKVLARHQRDLGTKHPYTLAAMHDLANSYHHVGRRKRALELREEVLALRREVNGPEDLETLNAMQNLANSYFAAGRRDEALRLREEALTLHRKLSGPEDPNTLLAMNNLASDYAAIGRQEEALNLREQALKLRRKVVGPEHPDTLKAMGELAYSYVYIGQEDDALKLREESLSLLRKVLGSKHPDTAKAMADLAGSYATAGRRDEAAKLQEEARALQESTPAK